MWNLSIRVIHAVECLHGLICNPLSPTLIKMAAAPGYCPIIRPSTWAYPEHRFVLSVGRRLASSRQQSSLRDTDRANTRDVQRVSIAHGTLDSMGSPVSPPHWSGWNVPLPFVPVDSSPHLAEGHGPKPPGRSRVSWVTSRHLFQKTFEIET